MRISDWRSDVCSSDLDREQQVWQPVRNDGESAERRRVEFLEDDPVTDHMLDAVGHHHQRRQHEIRAIAAVSQRDEGDVGRSSLGHGIGRTCRLEEHTSELQSLMRSSYAVFCLKKQKNRNEYNSNTKDL